MSFKRDGNDSNLLNTLRKRRIKDLLSEDIPEDEAKLLCNGRFTCTVCPSHPIFDTVCMLGVHRKGKKHLHNQEIHDAKKKELRHLIAVRKHEQYLRDGTTSINMASTPSGSDLAEAAPYDPPVRKMKTKQGERKPKLDLSESSASDPYVVCAERHGERHTPTRDSSAWRDLCQQQTSGPVRHDKQLKNIFKHKVLEPVRITPYQSMRAKSTKAPSALDQTAHTSWPPPGDPDPHMFVSSLQRQHNISPSESQSHQQLGQASLSTIPHTPGTLHHPSHGMAQVRQYMPDHCDPLLKSHSGVETCGDAGHHSFSSGRTLEVSTWAQSHTQTHQVATTDRQQSQGHLELVQKYKLLQGSGWKRDWDGKWIKDENAEFDSDEEPPDVP